jgi:DNA-binding transcriptional ArsR family regulator
MKTPADEKVTRFAPIFKALSDPTRQKIVLMLEGRKRTVSEIVEFFNLSQPTISRHLSVLKNAGLVTAERRGQNVYYDVAEVKIKACCIGFFSSFACCQPVFSNMELKGKKA